MQAVSTVSLVDIDSGFKSQIENNKEGVDRLLREVALHVAYSAKNTAAFVDKTGNLRKSIKWRKSKFVDGGYIVVASGKSGDKGYHAHLVEMGHVLVAWGNETGERVPPHPFMRPALEQGRQLAASKIGSGR